jgi:hypothetical protein
MNDFDQERLALHLIEANRVLTRLESIEARDGSEAVRDALRDALKVYCDLLRYQFENSPTGDAASRLQIVADRLQARLLFFSEPV